MTSRNQRGVAVITAMLIVALAASTATYSLWRQSLWARQAGNIVARGQAEQLALAAVTYARDILATDARDVDHPGEGWARPFSALPGDTGEMTGRIADQQALFNLNNLLRDGAASTADVATFRRLLELLSLPPDLANAVVDWIDPDEDQTFPGGAEHLDYLGLDPPYRAANRPLMDVGELARVKGFDDAILRVLAPFVTALPGRTAINVNTAPAPVLTAAISGLSLAQAESMVRQRTERPFRDQSDFRSRLPATAKAADEEAFDVKSTYFSVTVLTRMERAETGYQALLARNPAGWPGMVWIRHVAD